MKKRFLVMTLMLSMLMVLASVSTAFATLPEKGYGYTIKVYAGEQGHFESPKAGKLSGDKKTITIKADAGDPLTINESQTGFVLDNKDYYVRGFRKAGHDNDELIATLPSVDSDEAYEVAYGLKGGMVKYYVRYLDGSGDPLHDEEEFYGMAGDKPVISFKYVDGYQPQAYNLTKTLSENEDDNVFEFRYAVNEGRTTTETSTVTTNNNADNNGTDNTGANGANGNATGDNAGNNTPANVVDLDDGQTPLADGADGTAADPANIEDSQTPKAGFNPFAIGAVIAAILAILCAALVILRLRRDDDDEEYEEI